MSMIIIKWKNVKKCNKNVDNFTQSTVTKKIIEFVNPRNDWEIEIKPS